MLAEARVRRQNLAPDLDDIVRRTVFFTHAWAKVLLGFWTLLKKPSLLKQSFAWARSLPHRTRRHKRRFFCVLLLAASVQEKVRGKYTYLHAHFAGFQTELAMCLSKLTGIPYGATWHAYGIWRDRNILKEKISSAKIIMTCTDYNAQHLKKLSPEDAHKIYKVYHGLDFARMPEPFPVSYIRSNQWLAVGRLIPKKGFEYLIEAIYLLKQRNFPVQLTIVGDGDLKSSLKSLISRLDLRSQVTLAGYASGAEVWHFIQAAKGLIAPSVEAADGDIDGIPNVILEAMAQKRPVIGSDISGIPEVIIHEKTGILVPQRNAQKLAEAIERLSTDPKLAADMGERAAELVSSQFNAPENTSQLSTLIARTAAENRPPVKNAPAYDLARFGKKVSLSSCSNPSSLSEKKKSETAPTAADIFHGNNSAAS